MAEIKSTLELAMERTKKVAISDKEKEEIKQKEILQKATSLFYRHREGHLSLNDMMKEMEKMEETVATTVKQSLLSQWIDALSLEEDAARTFQGIESFKGQNIDETKEEFRKILLTYQAEKEKLKERMKEELTKELRKDGIYGNAVEPKLEGSEIWKKENEKLHQSYRMKLEEIKGQLRGL